MIKFYADVMPDGRVRACLKYDLPEEGPPTPEWETQAEGSVRLIAGPISWAEPFPDAVLHYSADKGLYWKDMRAFAEWKDAAAESIDSMADAARLKYCPEGRATEYARAEQQAMAYRDAGYTGVVPYEVAVWATAKDWTARESADDILAAAARAYDLLGGIRALRLIAKESIKRFASSNEQVDEIVAKFKLDLAELSQTGF